MPSGEIIDSSALASLREFYETLHRTPELSGFERETAKRLTQRWTRSGFDPVFGIGGYGVVGRIENGPGPVVLLRTDMDALPIHEETGLPYASEVIHRGSDGEPIPVMHACGHDMHMTVLTGAAEMLVTRRDRWRGTVILVGQPAEETGVGARKMIADGLFERFPRPDFAFAWHVHPQLAAGRFGFVSGITTAHVDSVDISVNGRGGHGAYPHETVDPVVLAAQLVNQLQTLVSRETPPLDSAVVTVGSIHGGSARNVIPEQVELSLTIRTCREAVRQRILRRIREIAGGLGAAAGLPPELRPEVREVGQSMPSVINDPALTERLESAFRKRFGEEASSRQETVLAGEDFSQYACDGAIPAILVWLGAVPGDRIREAEKSGRDLPGLHSPRFAPDPDGTIASGVSGMVAAVECLCPHS